MIKNKISLQVKVKVGVHTGQYVCFQVVDQATKHLLHKVENWITVDLKSEIYWRVKLDRHIKK